MDKNGVRVTGFVTIGESKYYLDPETGAVQTGCVTIKGKDYYFSSDGKLLISGKENGFKTNKQGIITARPKNKILIAAGHNQVNDSGAVSALGNETNYTRDFAARIVKKLKSNGKVQVEYFLNGDLNRSMYALHRTYIANAGISVKGDGKLKSRVLSVLRSNSQLADLTEYAYVLEIHFNATAESNKDPGGDGKYKGLGFFINKVRAKGEHRVESKILEGIKKLNFNLWGGGIVGSDYYNMRICKELGVAYGLLETAFIDDADDMKFYKSHADEMAQAVADGISAVYG